MDNAPGKQTPTLSDFFSFAELGHDRLAELSRGEELSAVREELAKKLKGPVGSEALVEQILRQVGDLLGIDVPEVLLGAWTRSKEIRAYADPAKYPPGETFLVPLAEHTITSDHRPTLEPYVNDVALGKIEIDAHLELTLQGVVLQIQGGKIKQVTLGTCRGEGAVTLAGAPLLRRESEPFELPGGIDLGDGWSIPAPA